VPAALPVEASVGEGAGSAASTDLPLEPAAPVHCASAPRLLPDGAVPPAPPHAPLGQDIDIPNDRPAYILPGNAGDPRVIIYLHGMCGDLTAADYFREAVRAHGTLIAVRGDTPCANGRFKWRDDASKIQTRIRAAFKRVNEALGGALNLDGALLFGYSQGAERAERVAALYPKQYPRLVLGGPPTKASPQRLARAQRVAILGGELETTENMRLGHDALINAGIPSRFFTLDCAYHGYFGEHAESQLTEVLDWVMAP
jgi:predicted esterase